MQCASVGGDCDSRFEPFTNYAVHLRSAVRMLCSLVCGFKVFFFFLEFWASEWDGNKQGGTNINGKSCLKVLSRNISRSQKYNQTHQESCPKYPPQIHQNPQHPRAPISLSCKPSIFSGPTKGEQWCDAEESGHWKPFRAWEAKFEKTSKKTAMKCI